MKGGTLEYKCRRCGEIHKPIHTPSLIETFVISMSDIKGISENLTKDIKVDRHGVHYCGDGGFGVTDLIGGIEDKD